MSDVTGLRKYTIGEIQDMDGDALYDIARNRLPNIASADTEELRILVSDFLAVNGLLMAGEPAESGSRQAEGRAQRQALRRQNVTFSYPPFEPLQHPYAGRTLQEAFDNLRELFGMPPNTMAFVDGVEVPDKRNFVFQGGEKVQFHRPAGSKG